MTSPNSHDTKVSITAGGRTVDTTVAEMEAVSSEIAGALGFVDFYVSDEVETVAQTLLERHAMTFEARRLDQLKILYLLKARKKNEGLDADEFDAIAKAVKAPPIWRDVFGVDVVVWVREIYWKDFTETEREAVVLHELCHIDTDEKGRATLKPHDLEEFGMVVRLYGAWRPDVERFGRQLALFENAPTQ